MVPGGRGRSEGSLNERGEEEKEEEEREEGGEEEEEEAIESVESDTACSLWEQKTMLFPNITQRSFFLKWQFTPKSKVHMCYLYCLLSIYIFFMFGASFGDIDHRGVCLLST